MGTSFGAASNGKVVESSLNTAISYGVKKRTGKSIFEHAIAYSDEMNPKKEKEPCISFIEKSNSEICKIVKQQISLTKAKLKNEKIIDKSLTELSSSLLPTINEKSKIKYLD